MKIFWRLSFAILLLGGCGKNQPTSANQHRKLTEQEIQQISEYLTQADALSKAAQFSASDSTANLALQVLGDSDDPYWRYRCHFIFCMNAWKNERNDEGIQQCMQWVTDAAAAPDSIRGYYHSLLGRLYFGKEDFEGARPHLEQAADLLEKSGRTKKLAGVYNNLAPCLIRLGDYDAATHYLKASIRLNAAANDSALLAINYRNLGRNYNANAQSKEAIACLQRSLDFNGEQDATYFEGMTKAYFNLDDFPRAQAMALKLLQSAREEVEYKPSAYQWLGLVANARKQPAKAVSFYQKALADWIATGDTAHYDFGKTRIFLGEAYLASRQPPKALGCFQDALNGFIPEFHNSDVRQNPTEAQLPNEIWVMEALLNKASAWEQCFEQKNPRDSNLLVYALQSAEMATSAFLKMKNLYEEDASKLNFDQYGFLRFYEKALQLSIRLADLTQNKSYQQRAFYIAQRSKAGILRNALQERAVLFAAHLPPDSLQKISLLERKIADIDKRRALEKDSLAAENLEAERFQFKRQWTKMQRWAKGVLPPPGNPANLSAADLQDRLPADGLLLEYFVGEQQLYTFALGKNGFEVFQSARTAAFESAAQRMIRAVSDQAWMHDSSAVAEAAYLQSASYLYEHLLAKPLARFTNIHRLLVVPDGVLGRLPFAALLTQPYKGSWRDTKLPVLLHQYAVGYLYSSALLQRTDQVKQTKYGFGGFGADYRDPLTIPSIQQEAGPAAAQGLVARGVLAALDNADDEVDSISRLTHGDKWLNLKATKANFLQNGSRCGILHFALHTVASPPGDLAGFYLLFSKTSKNEDNFLSSNELASMHLQAELAVLSACYSGQGKFQQGEGMMNLGRAFALSGCPAAVVNLWQANDAVSKKIMIDFYKNLKAGVPKNMALQQAQLAYLQQTPSEGAAPFFWANFVLMGDASPLVIGEKRGWW